MAKVFQLLVPDNTKGSRIISCENQVTELFVIDRADKKFVSENTTDLTKPALYKHIEPIKPNHHVRKFRQQISQNGD